MCLRCFAMSKECQSSCVCVCVSSSAVTSLPTSCLVMLVWTPTLHHRNCLSTVSLVNSTSEFFWTQELRSGTTASSLHFSHGVSAYGSSHVVKELLYFGGTATLIVSVFPLISYPGGFMHRKFSVNMWGVPGPPMCKPQTHPCLVSLHLWRRTSENTFP